MEIGVEPPGPQHSQDEPRNPIQQSMPEGKLLRDGFRKLVPNSASKLSGSLAQAEIARRTAIRDSSKASLLFI